MKALVSCFAILLTLVVNVASRKSEPQPRALSVADMVCALPEKVDATACTDCLKARETIKSALASAEAKADAKEEKASPKTLPSDDTDPFGQTPLLAQAPTRQRSTCGSGGCASGQCGQAKQQQAVTLLPNGLPVRNTQSTCGSGGCNSGSASGCNSGGCSGGGRRIIGRLRR